MPSTFEHVSGNPLFGVTRDGDKSLKIIETERGSIAPRVIARSRQGECAAHQPDGNATVVPLDRAVSHGNSLAKHAAARRKQSRSWRNRTWSGIPSSLATCATGGPDSLTKRTASVLHASV